MLLYSSLYPRSISPSLVPSVQLTHVAAGHRQFRREEEKYCRDSNIGKPDL